MADESNAPKEVKQTGKSSLGIDENIAAFLAYLFGFISGLILLVVEKDSSFVRFHAMQSVLVFGVLFLIGMIPFIGWIASFVIAPIAFILWIILMIQALQGKMYKLPLVGDIAEKQTHK
jgi:uncharacterized membrane protein